MQICYKRMLLTVQAVEHDLSRGHAPDPEDHYKYRGYVTLSKCEKLSLCCSVVATGIPIYPIRDTIYMYSLPIT